MLAPNAAGARAPRNAKAKAETRRTQRTRRITKIIIEPPSTPKSPSNSGTVRLSVCDDAHAQAREAALAKCRLSIAQLAAAFGMASGVYGYAYEDECDDYQQRSDDDFHGYSPLNDSMCRLIRRWSRKIPAVKATMAMTAPHRRGAVAVPRLEMSHPKTLISVTTRIPSQILR